MRSTDLFSKAARLLAVHEVVRQLICLLLSPSLLGEQFLLRFEICANGWQDILVNVPTESLLICVLSALELLNEGFPVLEVDADLANAYFS